MRRFCLVFLFLLLASAQQILAQKKTHVYLHEDFGVDWIEFFENGRFEIVSDEICYHIAANAGIFQEVGDSIQLDFFQAHESQQEVWATKSDDSLTTLTIQAYDLGTCKKLSGIFVYAINEGRKKLIYTDALHDDSDGVARLNLDREEDNRCLMVDNSGYLPHYLVLPEMYGYDYHINVFLSKDPVRDRTYFGPTGKQVFLKRKGKDQLIMNGMVFTLEPAWAD